MIFRRMFTICCGAAAFAFAAGAQAVFLDFDALPASTNTSGVPNNPASVLTTQLAASDGIVFGRAGVSAGAAVINNPNAFSLPNGITGLDAVGSISNAASGDAYFNFVDPSNTSAQGVTGSLSFLIGDSGGDLDSWTIRAFDLNDLLIDTQLLSGVAHQVYTLVMPGIHRIYVENTTGTTAGFLIDDFRYDLPTGVGVPEPTTVLLLGLGLAGLGFARKRLH